MHKYLLIGHSHTAAVRRGYVELQNEQLADYEMDLLPLRNEEFLLPISKEGDRVLASKVDGVKKSAVQHAIASFKADAAILSLNGNEHNALGLFINAAISSEEKLSRLNEGAKSTLVDWIKFLKPMLPRVSVLLPPPPPLASEERLRQYPGRSEERLRDVEIESADFRLQLWKLQCEIIRSVGEEFGIPTFQLPESIFDKSGFLAERYWGSGPAHANTAYGRHILPQVASFLEGMIGNPDRVFPTKASGGLVERRHPYVGLPAYCYWKQSISELGPSAVDPVTTTRFKIHPKDRVATAGSCFAQHISRRLRDSGYNFFVAEKGEAREEGLERDLYDFSARYGNVYTARQLLQLFDRAFGYFTPLERVWPRHGGGFCDPFRPRIEPGGFATEESAIKNGKRHLAAVRRMFQRLDVFVFTLGLTECWVSRLDGSAYPMAPGVVGGEYDRQKYAFVNFSVSEVTADLTAFLHKLRLVNPGARVILTVSPVPLVATAEDRHVLVSTTYSKSVLRVAAEEIVNSHDNVYYFPSYEIITGQHVGNTYFGPDRRSVTERGVDHVMAIFMARLTEHGGTTASTPMAEDTAADRVFTEMEALAEASCDEEMLVR